MRKQYQRSSDDNGSRHDATYDYGAGKFGSGMSGGDDNECHRRGDRDRRVRKPFQRDSNDYGA
jgi:hypothetical protein